MKRVRGPDRKPRKPSRQTRWGPPRRLDWEGVLDRYAAGESVTGIGEALGMTASNVASIVSKARTRGDPRAPRRRAPNGSLVRGPRRQLLPADGILDLWARGEPQKAIAQHFDLPLGSVSSVVKRARDAGDPRAHRRRTPNHQPGTGRIARSAMWVRYDQDLNQLPLPFDPPSEAS